MKLWLKISLICTAVLLLIMGACSTLLLLTARDKILSLTIEGARTEQSNLQKSFEHMLTLYNNDTLGPVEKQSLVQYCFRSFADNSSVLFSGNESIYSDIRFDPEDYLALSEPGTQKFCLKKVNGTDVLIVGDITDLIREQYAIYTVKDITGVYDSISQLIWQFGGISIACILIGVALLIFFLFMATKPLKVLGISVKRIAQGEYAERVNVGTMDEVGELARDFNSMAGAVQVHVEELKEMMQRQQLFIGGLTHEFKTPLTSVIGHSETLLYTKMPEDIVERSLLHIHEQCKWLERLTQKLLKLITLQEKITLKEESVEALLGLVQDSVAETLQKRGVTLAWQCDLSTLEMDMDLMLSLLINLVDNASKASAAGQTIHIYAHDRSIEVIDQGIGIPEEEISRITEPFYMVDQSRSKSTGGTGLGLALVKRIADAHGASLAIESVPGQGTAVKVIFPDNKIFTFS
jgi:signal transduction histidine kinase